MKINVIIPCGGSGERAKLGYNKLRFNVGGMTLLGKTISNWLRTDVSRIILPASSSDFDWIKKQVEGIDCDIIVCDGGATRTESVASALAHIENDCDLVAVHDGARPFVSQEVINRALLCCKLNGNAVVCAPCVDSLRIVEEFGNYPCDRNDFRIMQTPQIFPPKELVDAYKKALASGLQFSDDASIYSQYGGKVFLSDGAAENIKITTADDLYNFVPNGFFVGIGWDTHQLVDNRKLILGGVEIPHTKGLLGHSDADVLSHAIMDALLSASHNRDIGCLFSDKDPLFKDINSMLLVDKVLNLIHSQGYEIFNVSATIMAQQPKLAGFIEQIQSSLAKALELAPERISLIATTTEKLGLVGREEAISVHAVASLKLINHK